VDFLTTHLANLTWSKKVTKQALSMFEVAQNPLSPFLDEAKNGFLRAPSALQLLLLLLAPRARIIYSNMPIASYLHRHHLTLHHLDA